MRILVLTVALAFVQAPDSFGQGNDSIEYIHGLPRTGDDTIQPQAPDRTPYRQLTRISAHELPPKLLSRLQRNDVYNGWENATYYYDSRVQRYEIHFRSDSLTRVYGFDRQGRPTTYDQFDNQPRR